MKSNYGFTLLELMVVIAIIAVVSGTSGFYFLSGLPERRVLSASRDLYAGIQDARSEAVNRGENVTITFDLSNDSYTITDAAGNQINAHNFPDFINLYQDTTGNNTLTYNSRGTGESARVKIKYYKSGPMEMGVRTTSTGGISLIDETDDNWS